MNGAKFLGASFEKRDEENVVFIKFLGEPLEYKLLNILEFNSTRKRMSVIVEDADEKIILLTKGADSVIMERLNKEKSKNVDKTLEFLEDYA